MYRDLGAEQGSEVHEIVEGIFDQIVMVADAKYELALVRAMNEAGYSVTQINDVLDRIQSQPDTDDEDE